MGRILPLIFVALCLFYFIQTISQFDSNLQKKKAQIQGLKVELDKQYEESVSELDTCIAKSVDTNASLAERNFDSKRRDFHRFLHRFLSKVESLSKAHPEFEEQLRQFVLRWLGMFSECSVDPVTKPLAVATAEEFDQCKGASEFTAFIAERVKNSEVKIISSQRQKDQEEISKCRSLWKTMKTLHHKAFKRKSVMLKDTDLEDPKVPADARHGWVQWGSAARVPIERKEDEGMWPIEIKCRCVKILLLSQHHIQLMLSFFLGFPIIAFEIELSVDPSRKQRTIPFLLIGQVVVCMLCIFFVLYEFVDIDIVQQLEQEILDLEAAQKKVEIKHQQMKRFYEKALQVADMWLNYTIPRMELMKQYHGELEDAASEEVMVLLTTINVSMGKLQDGLPPLEMWEQEQPLGSEKKKILGEMIMELTRRGTMESLMQMQQISSKLAEETKKITALPPTMTMPHN